jgi:hypothetical protein
MWDFPVVAALIAPRPLLILSGRRDSIFPPDGYHEVFQRAKRIYDLHSRAAAGPDRIREVDDDVEHSDPPLFLREARQWMTQWLKNDSSPLPLETNSPPKETAEDLACLTRIPSDTINFRVHNQFVATAPVKKPSSRSEWGKRRAEVRSQLHERVFRWFPTNPVPFETAKLGSSGGWHVRYGYADYIDCSFQTEAGVRVRAQLHTPKQAPAGAPLLIYVKRAVDSFYGSDVDELLPLMNRCPVLILNPRLTEQSMNPADRTDVERSAVWVGRTVASMQVWDILRTVEWAISERQLPSSRIVVYGKGEMGIAALYAAFFDEHISQVILNDPPGSHWQGPALLNVLRVTDIAELAGAIAPRRISSLTQLPTSFELTKAIYRLERASDQFDVAGSLPEAMEISRFGDLSVPRSSARRSRR